MEKQIKQAVEWLRSDYAVPIYTTNPIDAINEALSYPESDNFYIIYGCTVPGEMFPTFMVLGGKVYGIYELDNQPPYDDIENPV